MNLPEAQSPVGGNIQIKDSNINGCKELGPNLHPILSFKILRPREFKVLRQVLELSHPFMDLPYFPNKKTLTLLAKKSFCPKNSPVSSNFHQDPN